MKHFVLAVVAVLAVATVMAPAHALATAATEGSVRPEDYGFKSETEMNQYFSIESVETKEIPLQQLDKEQTAQLYRGFPFPNPIVPGTIPPLPTSPFPTTQTTTPTFSPSGSSTPTPTPTPYPTPYPSSPYDSGFSPFPQFPGSSYSGSLTDPFNIQTWITIGERLWRIVVDNQPTTNVTTKRVSVLPIAQQDWQQMENWQAPLVKAYEVSAKNTWGVTTLSFQYTVSYNYGGQFNGTGAFLANATVIPVHLNVLWGYKADVDGEAGDAVNMGTRDNPLAGIDVSIRWKFGSVLTKREGRDVFFLKGNGDMVRVTGKADAGAL
jgi:hypothetical protein